LWNSRKKPFEIKRWEACNGETDDTWNRSIPLRRGEYGVMRSNLKLMQHAIENNYPYLAIFEDDALFHKKFWDRWREAVRTLPDDWNVLYIGSKKYHKKIQTPHSWHRLSRWVWGWHAVVLRADAIRVLHKYHTENYCQIDEGIKTLKDLNAYVLEDSIVITLCSETESDIQQQKKHKKEDYQYWGWDIQNFEL
jgi:hypothetical protein